MRVRKRPARVGLSNVPMKLVRDLCGQFADKVTSGPVSNACDRSRLAGRMQEVVAKPTQPSFGRKARFKP